MVHNATATNIPFSMDHFAHFLISKQDGLIISLNCSLDKDDQTFVGLDAIFEADPQEMAIRAEIEIDTPFFDHTGRVEVKQTGRSEIQCKTISKTESQSQWTEYLQHDCKSTTKLNLGN